MKKLIFLAALLLIGTANAQVVYQKTYGGSSDDIAPTYQYTSDGGKIIVSWTNSFGAGGNDVLVVKTDAQGNTQWAKAYGGSNVDEGTSIDTVGSGYVVSARTNSFGQGLYDFLTLRLDASGNLIWAKTWGGSSNESPYARNLYQTTNGEFIFSGQGQSYGVGAKEMCLAKLEGSGNLIWGKYYGTSADNEWGHGLYRTSTGAFLISGRLNHTNGGSFCGLVKTDADGNTQWGKTYNSSGFGIFSNATDANDQGYIVFGKTEDVGAGNQDMYIIKTDTMGNVLWAKTYGGTNLDIAASIKSVQGGYLVSGVSASYGFGGNDCIIMKIDNSGNLIWAKAYGGTSDDGAGGRIIEKDGLYAVMSNTQSFGAGAWDIYELVIDANGYSGGCNEMIINPTVMSHNITAVNQTVSTANGGVVGAPNVVVTNVSLQESLLCSDTLCTLPIADFSYNVDTLTVNFTDQSTGGTSWWWDFGDANFSGLQNPQHTYLNSGTYTVCLTTTDSCGSDSVCFSVTVNNCTAPVAAFSYVPNGLTIDFTDISNSATSWWWDFGDVNFSALQNPQHTYASTGTYNVCLTITDSCGSDTTCQSVVVNDVGIGEQSNKSGFTIYPNPTKGKFTVSSRQLAQKIEVHDLFGRLVLSSTEPQIDMKGYAKGVYFVRIGETVQKLIIN